MWIHLDETCSVAYEYPAAARMNGIGGGTAQGKFKRAGQSTGTREEGKVGGGNEGGLAGSCDARQGTVTVSNAPPHLTTRAAKSYKTRRRGAMMLMQEQEQLWRHAETFETRYSVWLLPLANEWRASIPEIWSGGRLLRSDG